MTKRTARIRRMPTARRPWLVAVRGALPGPPIPRSFYTYAEALAHALAAVGLDRPAEHREAP